VGRWGGRFSRALFVCMVARATSPCILVTACSATDSAVKTSPTMMPTMHSVTSISTSVKPARRGWRRVRQGSGMTVDPGMSIEKIGRWTPKVSRPTFQDNEPKGGRKAKLGVLCRIGRRYDRYNRLEPQQHRRAAADGVADLDAHLGGLARRQEQVGARA